jgi:4-amino-4-deoxy-L-arabinose transferase-like glycosyltransferase
MADEEPVSTAGKPKRTRAWKVWLFATASGAACFTLMANQEQLPHGALYGLFCLLACIGGLLKGLGLLQQTDTEDCVPLHLTVYEALPGERAWSAPRRLVPAALLTLIVLGAVLGAARLPWAIAAALLVLLPAGVRRPGLMLFTLASGLFLPLLGSFGLWDPWETHYGEVSREILSRDDWISLWWAQDHWFWSKPIGIFWSEALVWSASGLAFKPDANADHLEWVLRLPIYIYSMAGLMAAYAAMARVFNPRAALLGGLALATTPYYAMLTHQAITDMPCVGTMVTAVMLLLLAVHEDPERRVRSYRLGPLTISAQEITLGFFLLICLPQILYLATRNVTLVHGLFAWHRDEFLFGSGHNPNVPGNPGLRDEHQYFDTILLEPLAQALFWAMCTASIVFVMRRERRAQALYMLAFYVFCGLSFMAKGAPGFALPGMVALLYLWSCKRWSLLFTGQLRVALGSLALVTASLPWFVAMYVRHGTGFTDRLVIHDHLNRLAAGVHGDTGAIQYFIQQFGYGTFPWIALAPLALGSWLLLPKDGSSESVTERRRRETAIVLGLWFGASFTLYSAMITKFHHYVFPAAPPAALLIGVLLDRMLGARFTGLPRWRVLACALLAPLPLVLGAGAWRGNIRGVLPEGLSMGEQAAWIWQHGWNPSLCALLIAIGLALLAYAAWSDRADPAIDAMAAPDPNERLTGAGLIGCAVLCAFVGRDLSWTTSQRPAGSERLIGLFIYNYDRPFPAQFDYRAIFGGFAIVATLLIAAAAVRALRPLLTVSLLGLSFCFAAFFLDVYMVDLSPHWSQRELVKRYYQDRKGPQDPLVAWQMNWKGENFYSGNRVAVFVELNNKEMTDWLDKNKGKTAYFVLEHGRLGNFRSMVSPREVKTMTTDRDNNKFILVRTKL